MKSAFRIIPIHPADYPLLGIRWNDMYYFNRALAMGLSSSCAILFESFSTALEWVSLNLFAPFKWVTLDMKTRLNINVLFSKDRQSNIE